MMIYFKKLLQLFSLGFVSVFLFSWDKMFSLGEEIKNSLENTSDSFLYDELIGNSSYRELFNQSFDLLNDSDILTNYTDENNFTEPNLVVTENWGSSDKPDSNQKYLSFTTSDEDICSCDLNSNYCDINCCCDSDCTAEDIKVFSKCHSQVLVPDKNYCYQKDIIYRNNTIYKMVKDSESSLFCIVHDNLKEHLRFKELPVLKSHRDLDVLLKYQSKFISSWNDEEADDESVWMNLKSGSSIIIETVDGKSKGFWKLPFACFTRMCSCNQEIRYLEDFNSFCSLTISNLKAECQTNSALSADTYLNLCITSHVKAMNSTSKCPVLIRVPYETHKLKAKYSSRICFNVVSAIHFTVFHSGSSVIDDINVKLSYSNITEDDTTFVQHFSVKYEWNNATDTEQRSGNPGYQVGLPILSGTNSSAMDIGEPYEITMQQLGLSVLDRDASSQCSSKRKVIQFGKNFKTSCFFKLVDTGCQNIYDKIMSVLLGSSHKQVFIGVFGNANSSNFDDWIEAYHEDREVLQTEGTCHLIKGLKINIAFAAVGTVVNPQYKILGVGYHYDKPQVVDISSSTVLTLSTSVSFFDVTEPAIAHYPKVPSIKANLPSDFFYPFSYGNQGHHISNVYLVLLMCTLFLLKQMPI